MKRMHTVLVAAALVIACEVKEPIGVTKREPTSPSQASTNTHLVVPFDTRPAVRADEPPPPISGGTLIITSSGLAIAADPARDRISIVDLEDFSVRHVELEPGDEPGRLAEDAQGRVHVALRRSGDVVTIDPQLGTIVERRWVCGAPRGILTEPQRVVVACAGGEVVELDLEGGKARLLARLPPGLRDVVTGPSGLRVTDFKTASLISLDDLSVVTPTTSTRGSGEDLVEMVPRLAWRTVRGAGGVYMLHQRALTASISLEADTALGSEQPPYYSGGAVACTGVAHTAVTRFADGSRAGRIGAIVDGVLAVDLAVNSEGLVALAFAGSRDFDAPRRFVETRDDDGVVTATTTAFIRAKSGLAVVQPQQIDVEGSLGTCSSTDEVAVDGQITSVAFASDDVLVALSREPATLYVGDPSGDMRAINLGGTSVEDTGHDLFHLDTGVGIACASCHPEGGDDGHVWIFSTIGARRTQALHVGLSGTEPFHWDGDMDDLSTLMEDVFVTRMGGVHQSRERLNALQEWIFSLRPPAPVREFDAENLTLSVGKQLFESAEVGCTNCHSGSKLTNSTSVDVGTSGGAPLQVPSLVGIAYRAPFIHTGCAPDLRARFDPECGGGDQHGNTSGLSGPQLDALIAYMETL